MSEPTTLEALTARVEAAEKRAAEAEKLAAAAVKAAGGSDTLAAVEAKLRSQADLEAGYVAARERMKRDWLPESRFRAQARAEQNDTGGGAGDELRQIIREEIARMVSEEAPPAPKGPAKK
jgi:predicted alpha/beta superfamily hydrolase